MAAEPQWQKSNAVMVATSSPPFHPFSYYFNNVSSLLLHIQCCNDPSKWLAHRNNLTGPAADTKECDKIYI
jgi:hypothetical protein